MENKATKRVVQLDGYEESLEMLASHGIYFLNGEIDDCITYGFTHEMVHGVATGAFKDKNVLVFLNSPGGDVQHGLAIYDCIRMLVEGGVHVDIFGMGLVASMGVIIMQAGSRRLSSPYTQFLVHQISSTIPYFEAVEVSKDEERVQESLRLNEILLNIIASRSGIDLEELKGRCKKRDYWMDPLAARELGTKGLIDGVMIIPEKIKELLNTQKS